MKSKKNKKIIKSPFLKQMLQLALILAVPSIPFLWVICTVFLEPVVPRTRTYFKDYEAFHSKAYMGYFPKALPESAQDVNYCYHVDFFKKGSGYSCILTSEDYEAVFEVRFEEFINKFKSFPPQEQIYSQYVYNGVDKKTVLYESDFNGKVDFLKKLLTADNTSDYYYLAYIEYRNGDALEISGIIMNDTQKQLVEFFYREPIGPAW